jgi:uncharacterized protein (DUF2141 family)
MTSPRCAMWCEAVRVSLAMAVALPVQAATVTADIGNVRNDRGHVHVEICPQDRFLKEDCPYAADAPARAGVTIVTIRNVPPGSYAVQAYQDENDNRRVDRALFGIPKEGVGFSNDARILLGPPKWKDAVFTISGDTRIHLNLRYFLGPSGPPPAH